tara:strand:- start:63 stop:248 length:186 start_codon:yes stop_codon:yes gene_type:complete
MDQSWFPTISELEAYERVRHRFLREVPLSERPRDFHAQVSQMVATILEQEGDPKSVIVELD